jgi:hypothetical protein
MRRACAGRAEAVRELAVKRSPRLHAERCRDDAALRQPGKKHFGLRAVVHRQKMRGAAHRLRVIVIGRVKQHPRPLELRVHDATAHGLVVHRHAAFTVAQRLRDAAEAALRVEGQRGFAACRKEQVIRKLHYLQS